MSKRKILASLLLAGSLAATSFGFVTPSNDGADTGAATSITSHDIGWQ